MKDRPEVLRMHHLTARLGVSRTTIYALMGRVSKNPKAYDPTFPKPVRLSPNSMVWRVTDIEAWLQSRPEWKP